MVRTFARVGSPFNFLGHMNEAQKKSFYSWIKPRLTKFTAIKEFHQIRAQQLRKTAGLLEAFYAKEGLAPTFVKESWDPTSHFTYATRDDTQPALAMQKIKEPLKEQLQHDDEAVFWMNWLRVQIERQEDLAQYAYEAPASIAKAQSDLDAMFTQPVYDAVLVTEANKGKFRVHQMDEPTTEERKQNPAPKNGG